MSDDKVDQRIIDLWDDYVHFHFYRRLFLEGAARLLGKAGAAVGLVAALRSDYAHAAMVAEADPRIAVEHVIFSGASGNLKAYLAKPKAPGKASGVLVVHQNRGLN